MTIETSVEILFWGLTAKDLLIAGGWFLTVVSWFVSNNQATKREKRKEVRSEIDSCGKQIAALLEKTRSYYCDPNAKEKDKSLAAEIRFELQRLIGRIERLENQYPHFEVIGACSEMLDSISGYQFESSERETLSPDDDLLLKIEADTHFLMRQLEDGFILAFP